MAKILVSSMIKHEFDKAHSALEDDRSKKRFATDLVIAGLKKLDSVEPPGEPIRIIPRANGNKSIEYDDEGGLKHKIVAFKAKNKYDGATTAARACLYTGLGIEAKEWNK